MEWVFISASNELGAFESGVVASLVGTVVAVVAGGAATMAVALSWTRLFPELSRMGRLDDLQPGTVTPYEILLDDAHVWPPRTPALPPPAIRTPTPGGEVRLTFGSCRWAAPPPGGHDPVGPDALDALAGSLHALGGDGTPPDVLLLVGAQVYADETSQDMRAWLEKRRDLSRPPGDQVADFHRRLRAVEPGMDRPFVGMLAGTGVPHRSLRHARSAERSCCSASYASISRRRARDSVVPTEATDSPSASAISSYPSPSSRISSASRSRSASISIA